MAKPELGQKQVCPNCQAKFYDLTRRPAHCPKCDTEFDPLEEALRNRRGRRGPGYAADEEAEDQVADKKADADEEEEEDLEASTPEIDQEGHEPILTPDDDDDAEPGADEAGLSTTDGDDDDDALADDDDDSVPFIEDEDDDGLDEDLIKPSRDDD